MNLIWEEELQPSKYDGDDNLVWRVEHHLKKVIPADPGEAPPWRLGVGPYKISFAWVMREGERKYSVRFVTMNHNDKTFRSLKAAKAYALAIVSLTT